MDQSLSYMNGSGLADLVVNSGLLRHSWAAILQLLEQPKQTHQDQAASSISLRYRIEKLSNCVIVAFVTLPTCTIRNVSVPEDLLSSYEAALEHFTSSSDVLVRLKSQLLDTTAGLCSLDPKTGSLSLSSPLIITGLSLGGSVASLFTLWILKSINQTSTKFPLCITFGSPLLGNRDFQESLAKRTRWNSCFLHVVSNQDPLPRLFVQNALFKPVGTFLLASDLGCTCIENPDIVRDLLEASMLSDYDHELMVDYGKVIENVEFRVNVRGDLQLGVPVSSSIQAGIILQLETIGVNPAAHQVFVSSLIKKLESSESEYKSTKMSFIDPIRKLNKVKVHMAYLEWYRKYCYSNGIGYYDSYKNQITRSDREVAKIKKFLTNYWKEVVEDAERNPHKEDSFIRLAWLYPGTTYRRMVEPLDIAEYYRDIGKKDYEFEGRANQASTRHYVLLEKWQQQKPAARKEDTCSSGLKKQNVIDKLTEDSCFWAKVEEAIMACRCLKDMTSGGEEKELAKSYLIKFEENIMKQLKTYAISAEIFAEGSSFMQWWRMRAEIVVDSHGSELLKFMMDRRYNEYRKGEFFSI